jgi:hypothetical protein
LNDLVASGLVYCTGKVDAAIYGLTSEADLHAVAAEHDLRSVANVAWLRSLLSNVRTQVNALWREVTEHAAEHPASDDDLKVTFYFGQLVTRADDEPPRASAVVVETF